ncbi:hypothetical protein QEN19_000696 [Hanseniaspora menglaensis]
MLKAVLINRSRLTEGIFYQLKLASTKSSIRAFSICSNKTFFQNTRANANVITSNTYGEKIPEHILNLDYDLYDKKSDSFIMDLYDSLEEISEMDPDFIKNLDANQGVIEFDVLNAGSYVINKKPPNKQIWLSSPISGPFRFDYDSLVNDWVSLRDNGDTKLSVLLNNEIKQASLNKYKLEFVE